MKFHKIDEREMRNVDTISQTLALKGAKSLKDMIEMAKQAKQEDLVKKQWMAQNLEQEMGNFEENEESEEEIAARLREKMEFLRILQAKRDERIDQMSDTGSGV